MTRLTTFYFSAAYGESTYNSSTYQETTTGSTATVAPGQPLSNAGGGMLSDTGFEIATAVSIACLIVFVTLIVRFARRKPSKN